MRIHIKTAHDWILREYADNWQKYLPDCTVSTISDRSADINFFVNYALYEDTGGLTVCYFTHRETDHRGNDFDRIARASDLNISMCELTHNKVLKAAPDVPAFIVRPGINPCYWKRDLNIGIVGREYPSGRKRLDWIDKLKEIEGIKINHANGMYKPSEMPNFYKEQDYVLITASNEGGPMPVPEAIARGKPLIMPRSVGWCDEHVGLRYNNYEELEELVKGLVYDHDTYEKGAKELFNLFTGLHHGCKD